jgi:hypothetical protein
MLIQVLNEKKKISGFFFVVKENLNDVIRIIYLKMVNAVIIDITLAPKIKLALR